MVGITGDGAAAAAAWRNEDSLAIYGYKKEARGNKYYGTVYVDDDARSREKSARRAEKAGRGMGQPTGGASYGGMRFL